MPIPCSNSRLASTGEIYCAAMPCEELERLRTVAVRIHQEIATKRARRQEAAQHEQRTSSRGHADMENFLQRRLQRASTAIEQHLSAHKCAP